MHTAQSELPTERADEIADGRFIWPHNSTKHPVGSLAIDATDRKAYHLSSFLKVVVRSWPLLGDDDDTILIDNDERLGRRSFQNPMSYHACANPRLPLSPSNGPQPALDKRIHLRANHRFHHGLHTPPVEDMSTAYQPSMAAYENNAIRGFPSAHPYNARSRPAMSDAHQGQIHRSTVPPQVQLQQPQPVPSQPVASNWMQKDAYQSVSQAAPPMVAQQTLPPSPNAIVVHRGHPTDLDSDALKFHSLCLPRWINPNGGDLAAFTAKMTCLFWFTTSDELRQAESVRTRPANAPILRLPKLARPHEAFRKWTQNVLSTTQVTQNVILLALFFIYRLKMASPEVKGRAGSEYRLLVVALMLGNKFLDDNTYTNKTWAEVSAFDVKEIHVMEVEFLSNMRYNLLASKSEWVAWLEKLSCFHEYYERALHIPDSPLDVASPAHQLVHSPLHSPTNMSVPDFGPVTPTALHNFSPTSSRSQQNWAAYQTNNVSPLASKPVVSLVPSRKRSMDEDMLEHPAKRAVPSSRLVQQGLPSNVPQPAGRLTAPNLALHANQQRNLPALTTQTQTSAYPPQQQQQQAYMTPANGGSAPGHVSLPPLQPGLRAMSTVYSPGQSGMATQNMGPTTAPMQQAAFAPTLPSHTSMGYGAVPKHRSPGSLAPYSTASPLPDHFGPGSVMSTPMAHNPISNSPTFYLQQRHSPYKPIRHVNTLLYPPPSASLDQYHMQVPLPPTQMHYQPIGRRNEVRTGVVPEYMTYSQRLPSQMTAQHHIASQ
ncbi:Meiotically up-regulated like protein-like protein [Emericellopsis cladophorae]|uniref:Meiotically up-regulated like protein-like protein n=1 Tax=Emericellopsis cladophorae TaxID=2686198 RepID=A0A9P9XZ08_9HYPO|nr:Meiotically up-regulated like protein-like protein [Emericellopsis cladophorae]KAI6780108.1 Meiotically up-regulated like protein-like protein [Emericellopsis cladophorae]